MQIRKLAWVLVVGGVLVAPHLKADTVMFSDKYGSGSALDPDYYFTFAGPGCSSNPSSGGYYLTACSSGSGPIEALETYAVSLATNTIPATVYIADPNGYVSDEIVTTINPPGGSCTVNGVMLSGASCDQYFTTVQSIFTYGLDVTGSPFTCTSVGGCEFTYSGSVQDIGVVTYAPVGLFGPTNGNITTLQFQFNTPESSTIVPLGLGLGLACVLGMRRKLTAG